jgi:hypothetical protein
MVTGMDIVMGIVEGVFFFGVEDTGNCSIQAQRNWRVCRAYQNGYRKYVKLVLGNQPHVQILVKTLTSDKSQFSNCCDPTEFVTWIHVNT